MTQREQLEARIEQLNAEISANEKMTAQLQAMHQTIAQLENTISGLGQKASEIRNGLDSVLAKAPHDYKAE